MNRRPLSMGSDSGHRRFATCGGITWLSEQFFATVSLLTHNVQVYKFDESQGRVRKVQHLPQMASIHLPENLDVCLDRNIVAIANYGLKQLTLLRLSSNREKLEEMPLLIIPVERNSHGIGFSPCGCFLYYTTIGKPGVTGVFHLQETASGDVVANEIGILENDRQPLVPKGVAVSPDGVFLAICYGPNAGYTGPGIKGLVAVHRLGTDGGILPEPISEAEGGAVLQCAEDIKFLPGGRQVVVTEQVNNSLIFFDFDPDTGIVTRDIVSLSNPEAKLDFPHGVGISPNGKKLAVTNYGSDNVNVYFLS